ncbi:MAG: dihydrofolate reductase family protein [Gulosibacter sp.]|uniref:dihydrofolate reductase family protein n=1 Tax=Gulosibacter sp. TaxID=2817531 RepID=UPI003F917EBF
MGQIIYDSAVTINGWIADSENSLQWLFEVAGGSEPSDDFGLPEDAAVIVEGSTTYEWVLAQENLLEHPERWRDAYGDKIVFVFTTRQLPVPEGAEVRMVSGPVQDALPSIRSAARGGDIWLMGGGELVGQFYDADALDVIALSAAPVFLDGGAPVLPRRIESDRLRLVEARAVGQFARLVYQVIPRQ